jgi:hypothetical protein
MLRTPTVQYVMGAFFLALGLASSVLYLAFDASPVPGLIPALMGAAMLLFKPKRDEHGHPLWALDGWGRNALALACLLIALGLPLIYLF